MMLREFKALGNPDDARQARRFFKTGKGEYGEGDRFLGIRVPVIRGCVKRWRDVPLDEAGKLLRSPWHEVRMLALLLMVARYAESDSRGRNAVYRMYLDHTRYINNWDLVDCSAEHVVGAHLFARSRRPLARLARSASLWERRSAVLATFHFIKRNDFAETLVLAGTLLRDPEDLMHKAVGWMLREVGNRDRATEERFLLKHYHAMPRTMLRYAIEKFPERERQAYLHGTK
jgi:3-methyladenine DNA glycosylase AlkD